MKNIFKIIIIIFCTIIYQLSFAQNGKIKGRIFDAVSNEPLPFVNVLINGTNIGTVSDADGNFEIKDIKPGFIQLLATFVGYEKFLSAEIQVSAAHPAYIELSMTQSSTNLAEVTVTGEQFKSKPDAPVSLRSISLAEIEYNPGSNRDLSKVIQSFPGVGFSPNFRSDVIVRGGGPSESKFYLDGVEIPNLNHFATQGSTGGAVGIINADLVNAVNYYSGAFPANRGNALSGVFEFTQMDGNKDRWNFKTSLGATEFAATVDGPVSKDATLLFSIRRSYLKFLFNALGLPFLPTFTDYQTKLRLKLNEKNELTIVSIGAYDESVLNLGLTNLTDQQRYILGYLPVNDQWNYAIGAVYKHYQKHSYQTIVLSRNMLNNIAYKYLNNDASLPKTLDYKSQEIENKIRLEDTYDENSIKLNVGVAGEYAKYNNSTITNIFTNGQLNNINYQSAIDFLKYAAFGSVTKMSFENKLALTLSGRVDAINYTSYMSNPLNQFSPRFSASYQLTPKFSLNFNTGRYFQLPAYTTLGFKDNNNIFVNKNSELKYIQSDQIVGGIEWKAKEYSQLTFEVFYKAYKNYPFSIRDSINLANKGADFGTVGDEAVTSTGVGRAYGFELMNRHRLPSGLNVIFSYTFVVSEFKDKFGNYIPSSWDNRNLLTLSVSKQFSNNWNAGFKWRFAGGLPYTPYDMATSAKKSAWDVTNQPYFDYSKLNADRLSVFHQLDVRVDKKYFFKKWSMMFYLDVQNMYNFKSQQPDIVLLDVDATGKPQYTDVQQTLYKLKSIKNDSGTVLPTIGITIEF